MSDDRMEKPHEIVIVRRRGGDDSGGHHGGAWKIAYADFVTAMMAFFLVMWLINASNEATRAQVASYFNPIKLTDSSTGNRGLKNKKDSKKTAAGDGEKSAGGSPPAPSDVKHEAEIMANPDKLLAKIEASIKQTLGSGLTAAGDVAKQFPADAIDESAPGIGDPFDPRAWEAVPPAPPREAGGSGSMPESAKTPNVMDSAKEPLPEMAEEIVKAQDQMPSVEPEVQNTSATAAAPEQVPHSGPPVTTPADHLTSETPSEVHPKEPSAQLSAGQSAQKAEAAEIAADISARLGTGIADLPASIDIKSTGEGILISLTDRHSFSMFKSGSAEPKPEMVRLVEIIAGVLNSRQGYIVVRGHTDSKPYRNKNYDNWQLSTARAHLAQYMLIRGGLDESRIRRVEGLADRDPKIPEDPQAPENRRIEILLGRGQAT